jgi:hypothetical protein
MSVWSGGSSFTYWDSSQHFHSPCSLQTSPFSLSSKARGLLTQWLIVPRHNVRIASILKNGSLILYHFCCTLLGRLVIGQLKFKGRGNRFNFLLEGIAKILWLYLFF